MNWFVRKGTDAVISLTFTNGGAYNTTGLTLTGGIYKTNGALVFSPTVVNGGATGIVTLTVTNSQTAINPDEYFWKLATTTPIDLVLLQGIFQVNDYLWDAGTDSESGSTTVNINGTTVTITIGLQ
jgi:hypothetical protein